MKGYIHIHDRAFVVSSSYCHAIVVMHLTSFLSMDQTAEKSRVEMAQKFRHARELQEWAAFHGRLRQARYKQEPSIIHHSAG